MVRVPPRVRPGMCTSTSCPSSRTTRSGISGGGFNGGAGAGAVTSGGAGAGIGATVAGAGAGPVEDVAVCMYGHHI